MSVSPCAETQAQGPGREQFLRGEDGCVHIGHVCKARVADGSKEVTELAEEYWERRIPHGIAQGTDRLYQPGGVDGGQRSRPRVGLPLVPEHAGEA